MISAMRVLELNGLPLLVFNQKSMDIQFSPRPLYLLNCKLLDRLHNLHRSVHNWKMEAYTSHPVLLPCQAAAYRRRYLDPLFAVIYFLQITHVSNRPNGATSRLRSTLDFMP